MDIKCFNKQNLPQSGERDAIAQFLFKHLEAYGDPVNDIKSCMRYALSENGKPGGFILAGYESESGQLASAVVVNETGMGGFIPENILVYIATHRDFRGKGIGGKMMREALRTAQGDVALHVEPDNPARRLYEQLGFTNKYLEMRYKKEQ
ncbi:MAG TPA: GNAT family N-acetyltransferase [Edaphocola sp.]|nr:GNAT family N-acetyltransferase [Edaphocola sp.]